MPGKQIAAWCLNCAPEERVPAGNEEEGTSAAADISHCQVYVEQIGAISNKTSATERAIPADVYSSGKEQATESKKDGKAARWKFFHKL